MYNESTKIHVSAPYWLSVMQLAKCGKCGENERLKNVEKSNLWIFGYPKMWENDDVEICLDTSCHIFGYACFFFIFFSFFC